MTRSVSGPDAGLRASLSRRGLVQAALALAGGLASPRVVEALGRTPVGGTVRLALPFASGELDPHLADDPLAALLAPAIADPLFALDSAGNAYPTLATELPQATASGVRVVLRAGLKSARGKALDARDVLFSLARARERGGVAVLAELPLPVKDGASPLAVVFPGAEPKAVALALASPLTALVPRGFKSSAPDGTGAFRATTAASSLVLERNPNAARGPAFLARIEVTLVNDLGEALRAFESERADLGWLGAGLYRPRVGAVAFEGPAFGWVVLRAGPEARRWGAPGVPQELLDRVPREPLKHLGLVAPGGVARSGAAWGGGDAELLVSAAAPALVELARNVAASFSVSGQKVTTLALSPPELRERRTSGRYSLLLDFVRPSGPAGRATLLTLLAAANPALVARPPQAPSFEAVDIARTLPLGVLGSLRISGARLSDIHALESWQLGAVFRDRAV
jgi:peptide/nickel transport system substrate-binding protein